MTTTIFSSDQTFGHVLSHAIYTVWNGFVSGVTSGTDCNFDVKVAPELFGADYAHIPQSAGEGLTQVVGFRICHNHLMHWFEL